MVPQALAPVGAKPSPRQLSFTFRASPFMNFLLTFLYLSPGQAPNWKTETQTGVGKPVLPRERSTGARGHRREKQAEKAAGFPCAPRSCSDLQTLVKFSLLIISPTSFLLVGFPLIPRKKTASSDCKNHFLAALKPQIQGVGCFKNFSSSHYTSSCCLCYFSGRGTGPKYFEANKCFKKISHSLKGSLEGSAAKCHNKSKEVGKGVLFPSGSGRLWLGCFCVSLEDKWPGLRWSWGQATGLTPRREINSKLSSN